MIDLGKFIRLTSLKMESMFVNCKFWTQRKLFVSTTNSGEIFLNGSGNNKEHIKVPVSGGDPINDFCIVDDNYILIGCEDSFTYLFDIRKGALNN